MSKELLAINVNENTEKKGGLTYLSWAWAWAEVLKIDPKARYEVRTFNGVPACFLPGDTALVCVEVVCNGLARECWLPVMDNRNKSIKLPDSFAINTAIMRCMTKAVSLHGLGLYLYAGEDLPQVEAEPSHEDEARAKRGAELEELALYMIDCHKNGKDMDAVRAWYDPATWSADNPTEQEERLYVWSLLRSESKLRSTIKANRAGPDPAAQ